MATIQKTIESQDQWLLAEDN